MKEIGGVSTYHIRFHAPASLAAQQEPDRPARDLGIDVKTVSRSGDVMDAPPGWMMKGLPVAVTATIMVKFIANNVTTSKVQFLLDSVTVLGPPAVDPPKKRKEGSTPQAVSDAKRLYLQKFVASDRRTDGDESATSAAGPVAGAGDVVPMEAPKLFD